MRSLISLAALLAASPVLAQSSQSTLANVPTGYQVPGCTYYARPDQSKPAIQVCRDIAKRTPAQIVRAMADPADPYNTGSGGSAGGAGSAGDSSSSE